MTASAGAYVTCRSGNATVRVVERDDGTWDVEVLRIMSKRCAMGQVENKPTEAEARALANRCWARL